MIDIKGIMPINLMREKLWKERLHVMKKKKEVNLSYPTLQKVREGTDEELARTSLGVFIKISDYLKKR